MKFEQPQSSSTTEQLARKFQNVRETVDGYGASELLPFADLETELQEHGFVLADSSAVIRLFNTDSLLCRSESFSKVLELLQGEPLILTNTDDHANMCVIAGGSGFKTAMEEGFSGKDVGGMVKTVITFTGENLNRREAISKDDELWQNKPTTAQVSLRGEGVIQPEDVTMVSFRFPVRYLAEDILTEDELALFDEEKLQFIVRHYVRETKTATH